MRGGAHDDLIQSCPRRISCKRWSLAIRDVTRNGGRRRLSDSCVRRPGRGSTRREHPRGYLASGQVPVRACTEHVETSRSDSYMEKQEPKQNLSSDQRHRADPQVCVWTARWGGANFSFEAYTGGMRVTARHAGARMADQSVATVSKWLQSEPSPATPGESINANKKCQ